MWKTSIPVRKTKMVAAATTKVMPMDQGRHINSTVVCTTIWNIRKGKRHEDLPENQTATVQKEYAKAKEDMIQSNTAF
jgi:hypothetical protein